MYLPGLLTDTTDPGALLEELEKNPGMIRAYFEGLMPSLVSFLLQIAATAVLLLVGSRIIRWIVNIVRRSLDKSRAETGVVTFLCSLIRYLLYFVLIMIVLSQFGVTTSSVVAVLGSAGLTLGLALQGSLSNFAGGVLILLLKPFVVGDYILDNGSGLEGTVSEISIFYTKLLAVDNKVIAIPNGSLSNTSITNYSGMDRRRVDITVGVSYDADLKLAKEALAAVVAGEERVLEPADIFVSALSDSSVELGVRVWVKTEDYWAVRWRMLEEVKYALDRSGISIPFPQMDVHLHPKEEIS